MPSLQPFECDLVNAGDDQLLRTVSLPVVPRVGEELDLDLGSGGGPADRLYRVVRVRYHVRPRKLVRADDLFGIAVYVAPAA
jgi:hypothetical protein